MAFNKAAAEPRQGPSCRREDSVALLSVDNRKETPVLLLLHFCCPCYRWCGNAEGTVLCGRSYNPIGRLAVASCS